MKRSFLIIMAAGVLLIPAWPQKHTDPFAGRWDLTITTPEGSYPSWMEFTGNDGQPAVRVVGRVGSVHRATDVVLRMIGVGRMEDASTSLSFNTFEWFGKEMPVTW